MSKAKYIPEDILSSIEKLPQESLGELVNFIKYLQDKNHRKNQGDSQSIQEEEMEVKTQITASESEDLIEQILTEVGEDIPSLSDYVVSRTGIY